MAIDVPAGPDQAMAEEYFEEDVVRVMWAASETAPKGRPLVGRTPAEKRNEPSRKKSSPVRIPAGKSGNSSVLEFLSRSEGGGGGDAGDDGEGEMIPPHVIVERRFGGGGRRTAFSVCTGNGRTLKGRDLRMVRNSVLMQTGFLEGRLTS